jgi:HD-GYP domain-containing protein (c-di-GMP phosphodiesterase class II)
MTTARPSAPPADAATAATQLVDELVAAMVNTRIYASNHPRVQGSIESVRRRLAELAELTRQDPICLGATAHFVVFQQRPLLGASIGASRLLAALRQWGSGGLELWTLASASELEELLAALASRPQPGQDFTAKNEQLAARQCPHVRFLGPLAENGGAGPTEAPPQIRLGLQFYQAVVDLLQTVTVSVCRGGRIDFAPVQTQAELMLKQLEAKNIAMLGLARQDQYDAFTFGHSVRVAVLSMHFAGSLTDDRDLLIRIGTAALLHDVGKSLIPFELLHSETTLTAEQRAVMNRHAELGAECLLDHHDADPLAIAAAFGHHRNPRGTGYPRTLHDHETTLVTAIVKICDVYEALTAARPYKQPMSPIRAYRVMLAMGDQFDQRLLKKFVQQNGIYPVGQFVELDTGEVAVVRRQTASPQQPVVAVLQPTSDPAAGLTEETLFDLSQVECGCARSILAELAPEAAQQRLDGRAPPTAAAEPLLQQPDGTRPRRPIADPFTWS